MIDSIFYKCFISPIFQVAFSALRFVKAVQEHGNKIVERMKSKRPYLVLHRRMEKDVWVRRGVVVYLA
jgi:hypothetical protein